MSENEHQQMQTVEKSATNAEFTRSTQALNQYSERPGIGGPRRQEVLNRVAQVAHIIYDNPVRVEHDASKSSHERTIHDPELAHLIALTIDENMTALAALNRRIKSGQTERHWHKTMREKNMLGARLGEQLATEVYNDNPLDATVKDVQNHKNMAILNGHKDYRLIK